MTVLSAVKGAAMPSLPAATGVFHDDINRLKTLGDAAIAFFSMLVVVAIIAVALSPNARTPALITSFFDLVKWAIGLVTVPVKPASNVALNGADGVAGSLAQDLVDSGKNGTALNGGADESLSPTPFTTWLQKLINPSNDKPADDIPTMIIKP